jgi:signal transduction histidine kinase
MISRFERISLRGRLMTIGVLGVAGALVLGGVILYAVLASSLTRTVQSEALASAREIAVLVNSGQTPDPVPASGAQVVQVLSADNRVVSASLTADRLTPLATPEERTRALAGDVVVVAGNRSGMSGGLQVSAVEAGPANDRVVVVAALPTGVLESGCALIAWRVIGAALRPVEELRSGASRIDGSSTDERLPVPPTHDEIAALATTLNEMLDRVSVARRTQRAFVADAAHELRSPLATMRTQLEVAARLGDGDGLPAELIPEVRRLSSLVEDLLLLARSDDGQPARGTRSETVDLGALAHHVASRYASTRVPVRVLDPAERSHVPGSYDELYRALANLVDNGVRHAASGVDVAVEVTGDATCVTVTDDGTGILEADRERVFDRFTRLDDARDRDSGGTGLGLAIARELLRRNGAQVSLEDAGPGVRAVVTLPAVRPS